MLNASPEYEAQRGLSFLSYEVNQEERTSLNLTPDKSLNLKNGFMLEFDYKQRYYSYGCVFRIIIGDKLNINFFSNQETFENYNYFTLAVDNREVASIPYNSIHDFKIEDWNRISLKIDPATHSIILSIREHITTINNINLLPTDNVRIFFGANNYLSYFTKDVTPMIIRDIDIYNLDNRLMYSWDMGQHQGVEIFDIVKHQKAVTQNGVWEIDKHTHWKKRNEIKIEGENPQTAFDENGERIFIAKDDLIYEYNLVENRVNTIQVQQGNPYKSLTNNLIYDPMQNKLISYHVGHSEFSVYDFDSNTWSHNPQENLINAMQHNAVIASDRNQLITFGGYGEHRYNAVLTKYDLFDGSREEKDLSEFIEPRYLSSAAYCGNGILYVMGGYGCKSGIQDGFTRNYYDLHRINTDSMSCRKIWQFDDNNLFVTFSQTMVVDQSEEFIYTLEYDNDKRHTSIRLSRFGLDAPEKIIFADTIPYKFHDVGSFCNLFLNKKGNEFVAIVSFLEDGETTVNIYTLPFPPLNESDLIQEKKAKFSWLFWGGIIGLIVLSVVFIYLAKLRKKEKEYSLENLGVVKNEQLLGTRSSAIYLLGGFQIIDKEGNDITGKFTGILKNLFLCILLKTLQDEKGVTSQFIEETLWRFMDQNSAINNRNVNMRKLRLLLQGLGDVNIINENNYWRLEDNSIYCDYKRILQLLKELKTNNYNNLNEALELIRSGSLLPATKEAWVDVYKSEYSNQVTDVLTELSLNPEIKSDLKLLLKMANAMLVLDSIDENAISLKCYALYHLGKKGLALKVFENFRAEYKEMLNTNPNIDFQTIIIR